MISSHLQQPGARRLLLAEVAQCLPVQPVLAGETEIVVAAAAAAAVEVLEAAGVHSEEPLPHHDKFSALFQPCSCALPWWVAAPCHPGKAIGVLGHLSQAKRLLLAAHGAALACSLPATESKQLRAPCN